MGLLMPYLLNVGYLLLLLAMSPLLVFRVLFTGKYRNGIWARLTGSAPVLFSDRPVIWFHAVSVGEVLLLRPLLDRLVRERSDLQFVLSTTTAGGFGVAKEKYPNLVVFWSPLDFTWSVRRVFDRLKPAAVVLAELELWPNLLLEAKRRGTPVAVVNARLGVRSSRGYQRFRWLLAPALSAIRWWGAQNEIYAERFRRLAPGNDVDVAVTGSLKFDNAPTERGNAKTRVLGETLGVKSGQTIWVAGSTMAPEEEIVLDAFASLSANWPSLRLFLAPRHAERFQAVADLLRRRGLPFARRSQDSAESLNSARVVLVDTLGELSALWGLADIGYVGGSLECGRGGQSMIEPAGFGVPACFGPQTWNFKDTVESLLAENGAVQIGSRSELAPTLNHWLVHTADAQAMGARAKQLVLRQKGAIDRTLQGLADYLPQRAIRKSA